MGVGRSAAIALALAACAVLASLARASAPEERAARAVPILMYHVIGDPRPDAPYPELFVSTSDFAGQMRWLAERGYTALTLRAVWDAWHGRREMPVRPIVVTFDDGHRGIATRAAPVLRKHHWPGVLDLDVSNVDAKQGFGEGRIRGLIRSGWELASHTLTHADLTGLDDASLRREVGGSRVTLRRTYGVPVDFFCYPAGRFDERVVAAVQAAGYLGATTTVYGLATPDDPYRLARVRVNRSDGVDGFGKKITELARR